MKLSLYDPQMNRIAILEGRFVSCMWSEGYNTLQPFTLEVQATAEYKKKVKPDCYVGRDDRKTVMLIKTVQVKAGHIIASGFQAARVLDDVACEVVIPAGSQVDRAIKAAYDASDGFEGVTVEESHLGILYDHQISNRSCLDLCTTMCQATDTGFRVIRTEDGLQLGFYRPAEDPNRILSERYGNLMVEAVTLSTQNLKNVAIVLGEGEGESRRRVRVDLSGGEQKRSMFVDARDILREEGESDASYDARLYARGVEKLLEKQGTREVALNPLPQEFGRLYDLGDVVTALLPDYGLRLQARIVRFTQKVQNNTTETTIEVGNITIKR